MKKKLLVVLTLALCAMMIAGVFATGCSKGSEPQKAAAPAKEAPVQKAAPAKEAPAPAPSQAEAEEEDEDKFGC